MFLPTIDLSVTAPKYEPVPSNPCLLGDTLCGYFQYDAFATALAIWSMLQMTWPGLLFVVQLYQVGQAKTTNEAMSHQRYNAAGRGLSVRQRILRSLSEIDSEVAGAGHPLQEESINLLESGGGDDDSTLIDREDEFKADSGDHQGHSHGHSHNHRRGGGGGMWGLLKGTARGRQQHGEEPEATNPFDFGLLQNCMGFWTQGSQGPLRGVNWYAFYEVEPTRTIMSSSSPASSRTMH